MHRKTPMRIAWASSEPQEGSWVWSPPVARYRAECLKTRTLSAVKSSQVLIYIWIYRRNHYTRPLEEAIHTHQSQWPKEWEGKNPLHGGGSFATMSPVERVCILIATIPICESDMSYLSCVYWESWYCGHFRRPKRFRRRSKNPTSRRATMMISINHCLSNPGAEIAWNVGIGLSKGTMIQISVFTAKVTRPSKTILGGASRGVFLN